MCTLRAYFCRHNDIFASPSKKLVYDFIQIYCDVGLEISTRTHEKLPRLISFYISKPREELDDEEDRDDISGNTIIYRRLGVLFESNCALVHVGVNVHISFSPKWCFHWGGHVTIAGCKMYVRTDDKFFYAYHACTGKIIFSKYLKKISRRCNNTNMWQFIFASRHRIHKFALKFLASTQIKKSCKVYIDDTSLIRQ